MTLIGEKAKRKLEKVRQKVEAKRIEEKKLKAVEDNVNDPTKADQLPSEFNLPVRVNPGQKKLIKSVGELIDSGKLLKGQRMLRKALAAWKKCTFRIGIVGNAGTGKSSLAAQIIGNEYSKESKLQEGTIQKTIFTSSVNQNVQCIELLLLENQKDREKLSNIVLAENIDVFVLVTDSWFTEVYIWFASWLRRRGKEFILVRTKIDIAVERQSKDENVVLKIKESCISGLKSNLSIVRPVHAISTKFPSNWNASTFATDLIQARIKTSSTKKGSKKKKSSKKSEKSSTIALSLFPMSIAMLRFKYELMLDRIWIVSAMATTSGVLSTDEYAIVADLELIKTEIQFYFDQFGLTEQNIKKVRKDDNFLSVWKLIKSGDGVKSLLKQASVQQKEEQFAKLLKLLPVIGGNVSFATVSSTLSFLLMELFQLAQQVLDQQAVLPGQIVPNRSQAKILEPAVKKTLHVDL
ncbi:Oidioi.mRNA.OKI2018_I69.XSR.g16396.t1.cds [Oikopleura dioica]|uniref:Oidioi.mRNA.OKI2018_I69.XSR.g16396.t1.cds n=1 Tax=Oikopleura dioica TaxID=34765 RepID=A0ABN7SFZ0_OIKDI|nr:Oidioi.mRNA.OKI2018_I69.XSR.g16396.t1.cds [Oikopleura dioica]